MRDHFAGTGNSRGGSTVSPVVITFTDDAARLDAYRTHLALDIPLLADPDRALYGVLGARRTSFARVWNPGTLALYGRLVVRGRRIRRPRDDTRQLGADAVVDADGRLRQVWLPPSPDARPSLTELAEAVRSAACPSTRVRLRPTGDESRGSE